MIIQRWQSVMLLIACVMMACFSFGSLGQVQTADFTFNFTSLGFESEGIPTGNADVVKYSTWYFFAVSIMSAILPLIAIFCYHNLKLQKRLCLVSIMFIVAASAVAAMLGYTTFESASVSWSTAIIEPLIAVIAIIFGYRLICSDEKKLRSVDRFRD